MQRTLVVIPARMQSSRLPDKPLAEIAGRPMIVHVWQRAMAAEVGRVVVATDNEAILATVRAAGGEAVMTRADHPSGSDRVFEAVSRVDPAGDFEFILNLQGDLPMLAQSLPRDCLAPLLDGDADIATIAAAITKPDDRTNPNAVKVVGASTAVPGRLRALYFPSLRHVCLPPRRARTVRFAQALTSGKARAARAVARAGGRHAHRCDDR
jgi:3-deoxy-manno-octulosonate cytidylyltransferase (CMP-KDO synthetase)